MQEISYIYILSNGFKHLYIGVTADLHLRVLQHKNEANLTVSLPDTRLRLSSTSNASPTLNPP